MEQPAPDVEAAGPYIWEKPPAWSRLEVLALAGVSLLGVLLRIHEYAQAPLARDNWDEFGWAWSGLTLITRHVPYSWSFLPSYPSVSMLATGGVSYPIVHPYLDHPPLFSLIVGGYTWLLGARDLTDVTIEMIRPVPIVLSIISLVLLYLLARRTLGQGPAIIATILMATAPMAILFSREVESEALLAPLLLVALLLSHHLLTGSGRAWTVVGLVAVCLAASLTKVPGVAVGAVSAAILASAGRWRPASLAIAAGLAGLLLYAAYGALIDWNQFLAVVHDQEIRRHGVMAAYDFIGAGVGVGRSAVDGWWLLGWVGIGALMVVQRPVGARRMVVWPTLIFALVIMLLADQRVVSRYGWYRIPVYPMVYCGAGYLVWLAVSRVNVGALMAVLVLGGATATTLALGSDSAGWTPSAWVLAIVVAIPLVPAVLASSTTRSSRLHLGAQTAVVVTLVVVLALNVVESMELATRYRLF